VNTKPLAQPFVIANLTILFLASAAAAHDSWLVADRHTVNDGDPVWLAVITGPTFPVGDQPMEPGRVAGLVDRFGESTQEIVGLDAKDRTLSVRTPIFGGGIHVIGCELAPRTVRLDAEAFDRYLADERAETALMQRRQSPPAMGPIIERYTKYAKTIVRVEPADPADEAFLTPIGHRLEIVPLSNPCDWQSGSNVQVRVLLDGHPWPDMAVSAGHDAAEDTSRAAQSRTDANGRASIALTRPGHWFVKAHLIRSTNGLTPESWRSLWATLTFDVQGQTSASGDIQAIRAVHGELTPWAVIGYRMGRGALEALSLPRGDDRLLAVYHGPAALPHVSAADGIQAATGATIGRLTLRLQHADFDALRCEFTELQRGLTIVCRPNEGFLERLGVAPGKLDEQAAMKMLTLPDEELFELQVTEKPNDG
jgi:uncharacterized GH25 family protein